MLRRVWAFWRQHREGELALWDGTWDWRGAGAAGSRAEGVKVLRGPAENHSERFPPVQHMHAGCALDVRSAAGWVPYFGRTIVFSKILPLEKVAAPAPVAMVVVIAAGNLTTTIARHNIL
jgi:hypothetical protein